MELLTAVAVAARIFKLLGVLFKGISLFKAILLEVWTCWLNFSKFSLNKAALDGLLFSFWLNEVWDDDGEEVTDE